MSTSPPQPAYSESSPEWALMVYTISHSINTARSVGELTRTVLDTVVQTFSLQGAILWLYSNEERSLRPHGAAGDSGKRLLGGVGPEVLGDRTKETVRLQALLSGVPQEHAPSTWEEHPLGDSEVEGRGEGGPGSRRVTLLFPLIAHGKPQGVLEVLTFSSFVGTGLPGARFAEGGSRKKTQGGAPSRRPGVGIMEAGVADDVAEASSQDRPQGDGRRPLGQEFLPKLPEDEEPRLTLEQLAGEVSQERRTERGAGEGTEQVWVLRMLLELVSDELAVALERERRRAVLEQKLRINRAARAQLMLAARHAALSTIASGVAHEFRSDLRVVEGVMVLAEGKAEAGDLVKVDRQQWDTMGDAIAGLSDLCGKLEQASVQASPDPVGLVSLAGVVQAAVDAVAGDLERSGVKVEVQSPPYPLPTVRGTAFALEQAMLCLLANAREAIVAARKGRGIITVSLSLNGDMIEIQVSDDGEGVKEDLEQKIFAPFFTTRQPSSGRAVGLGLGLPIVRGILQRFGGTVHFERPRDNSARFVVLIPAADALSA